MAAPAAAAAPAAPEDPERSDGGVVVVGVVVVVGSAFKSLMEGNRRLRKTRFRIFIDVLLEVFKPLPLSLVV